MDATSLLADRRARRVKTDAIDVEGLLRAIDRGAEGRATERSAQLAVPRRQPGGGGPGFVARLRALGRQAYRYLQEAQEIGHSVPIVEPSVPITLKIPGNIVRDLRAYSVTSGLTLGEIVTRAVTAFLATVRRRG